MKISAINVSAPLYRKKGQTDVNLKKSSPPASQNTVQKQYNPSFGFDPVTIALYAGYALIYGAVCAFAVHETNYKEMESELARKEIEEKMQRELIEISNAYGISVDDAKSYHDKYLERASIPPTGDGNEKGFNAVMGYPAEKYKLAMDVIVPAVIAQKDGYVPGGTKPPSGVLLYGPPGGGKTYIADKLCEHLEYFNVKTENITFDKDNHKENVDKIAAAFTEAEENFQETGKYTLIRLPDDIDNYIVDRNADNAEYNAETAALIKYAENCSEKGAIWLSTANNPRKIDKAVLRPGRTDVKIAIGNMEDYAVADMVKYSLYKCGETGAVDTFDYKKVVDTMKDKGYVNTPYELENIVTAAHKRNMQPDKPVDADMVIAEMVNYNENEFPTLDDSAQLKFIDDVVDMELNEPDGGSKPDEPDE